MLGEIGRGRFHLAAQMNERAEPGAPLLVLHAEYGGMDDERMALQQGLDFLGLDIAAGRYDEPVAAPGQIEKTLLVEMTEIADRQRIAVTADLFVRAGIAREDEWTLDE